MPNEETDRAKNLLVKMYLELKMWKKEKIEDITNAKIIEEKEQLKKLSLIDLINYISNNINILIEIKSNLKYEEKIRKEREEENENNDEGAKNLSKQYEELLIKAENDIRKHIKVRIIFLTYFIIIYR
jgi:hypothetical protein